MTDHSGVRATCFSVLLREAGGSCHTRMAWTAPVFVAVWWWERGDSDYTWFCWTKSFKMREAGGGGGALITLAFTLCQELINEDEELISSSSFLYLQRSLTWLWRRLGAVCALCLHVNWAVVHGEVLQQHVTFRCRRTKGSTLTMYLSASPSVMNH